jgi:hypothetical protein
MKTERVTILAAPAFKAFLTAEAEREGLSVGELVRRRCERRPSDDEATLAALAVELTRAVREARRSLQQGLAEAQAVLDDLASAPGREPADASADTSVLMAAEPGAVYRTSAAAGGVKRSARAAVAGKAAAR